MSHLILGCGYLGRRVAAAWLARGERVYGTTRSAARAAELSRLGVEPIVCDVLDPASLRGLPVARTVVHCVGFDRHAGAPMRRVYVEGLINILGSLRGDPRLLHVSSTSVYGQTDGSDVDEAAATRPPDEAGQVVLDAERALKAGWPTAVLLRFAGIYGPGRLIRARDIQAGRLLAIDAEKWLNLIHVEDGAAAVLAAAEKAIPGATYNVSDGTPVRRRDFYSRLAELLGAPPPKFVPPPEPLPASERVNRRVMNGRLCEQLGFAPVYPSYAEGLAASR